MIKIVKTLNKKIILLPSFVLTITKILLGILLMYACSKISIPLKPVPITLQTVAALLIGMTYTVKSAFFATFGYVLLRIVGITDPHLAGIDYFLGATCGYMIGFILSATIMAKLRTIQYNKNSLLHTLSILFIGQLSIFICGITWLTHLMGFKQAINVGLLPFIWSGICKIFILSFLLKLLRKI